MLEQVTMAFTRITEHISLVLITCLTAGATTTIRMEMASSFTQAITPTTIQSDAQRFTIIIPFIPQASRGWPSTGPTISSTATYFTRITLSEFMLALVADQIGYSTTPSTVTPETP